MEARLLRCDINDISVASVSQLLPLLRACMDPGLRNLQELHLKCSYSQSDNSQRLPDYTLIPTPCSGNSSGLISGGTMLFEALVESLAISDSPVRVLSSHIDELISTTAFPSMRHLRHLLLSMSVCASNDDRRLCALASALPQMPHLLTVHLDNTGSTFSSMHMPPLDLRPCTSLQSLRLAGIAPADLKLAPQTKLNLDLSHWELACAPVWATVLPSVASLFYNNISKANGRYSGVTGCVPWLSEQVLLDTMCLDTARFGPKYPSQVWGQGAHMAPAFVGAKHFRLIAGDVLLQVPAQHGWQALEVWADDFLTMHFEDFAAFVRTPPSFTLECKCVSGTEFDDLRRALGDSVLVRVRMLSEDDHYLHLCNRCTPDSEDWCTLRDPKDSRGWYRQSEGCRCGACASCLIAAGKMVG